MRNRNFVALLFLSFVLWNCAGSNPAPAPEKKVSVPAKIMLKADSPVAESLFSELPVFAQLFFADIMDSLPGEYYYSVKDSSVDSLFVKKSEKIEPVASIEYKNSPEDSIDYYLLKKDFILTVSKGRPLGLVEGNMKKDSATGRIVDCEGKCKMIGYNGQGLISVEYDFPNHLKRFYDNGNLKMNLTGTFTRKVSLKEESLELNFRLEDGEEKHYFENGQVQVVAKIRNGKKFLESVWSETGTLLRESHYDADGRLISEKGWTENEKLYIDVKLNGCLGIVNSYYENEMLKDELSGCLYKDIENNYALDSGTYKAFSESGALMEQNEWKNKKIVSHKKWNEQGVLTQDISLTEGYAKSYYDSGEIEFEGTGILYRGDDGAFEVDSGMSKVYSESGQILEDNEWKNRTAIVHRAWNEQGVLKLDLSLAKNYMKEYYDSGKIKSEATGILYRDGDGSFRVDSGASKIYSESGRILEDNEWKNRTAIVHRAWNERGVLKLDCSLAKNYMKEYYDSGKIKSEATGILYRDGDGSFRVDSGASKIYSESGQVLEDNEWKNRTAIVHRAWNENGVLVKDVKTNVMKSYWNNGKLQNELIGKLYQNENGVFSVDSGVSNKYSENGTLVEHGEWKDKKLFLYKIWNEKGVLTEECSYPNYLKTYYDDGKIQKEIIGLLYRDDDDMIQMDSGLQKIYFESGKLAEQFEMKRRKVIYQKKWNENGILLVDFSTPNSYKSFFETGKIEREVSGKQISFDEYETFFVQDGFVKDYFESGKIKGEASGKQINFDEHNTIIVQDGFMKTYFETGKIHCEVSGKQINFDEHETIFIQDGFLKRYFETGKIHSEVSGKQINIDEHGTIFVQDGFKKDYLEDGTLTADFSGTFSSGNEINLQEGTLKIYSFGRLLTEISGKHFSTDDPYRKKEGFVKVYDENGNVKKMLVFKNGKMSEIKERAVFGGTEYMVDQKKDSYENDYLIKTYVDNVLKNEKFGILKDDGESAVVVWGYEKEYSKNGQLQVCVTYKNEKMVAKKKWDEQGKLSVDVRLPIYYREFDQNGNLTQEALGTIVEENGWFKVKEGVVKSYGIDGNVKDSTFYKDFQEISK